jgi:hypothetical protein
MRDWRERNPWPWILLGLFVFWAAVVVTLIVLEGGPR